MVGVAARNLIGNGLGIEADAVAYTDRCLNCEDVGVFRDHDHRTVIVLLIVGFPTGPARWIFIDRMSTRARLGLFWGAVSRR